MATKKRDRFQKREAGRPPQGSDPRDMAAAAALAAAGGECSRCGRTLPGGLVAVEARAGWQAECFDRRGCDAAIRRELAEGDR